MANIITYIRIICSIALLFCPVFSPMFYTLYIVAGLSDMIDGAVARKTGTASDLKYSGVFVCALATFAAIQEGYQ